MVRTGWFKPVHVKSIGSQKARTLAAARKHIIRSIAAAEQVIRSRPNTEADPRDLRSTGLARRLPICAGSTARASDASIYKLKAKFGGMEVSEAKRLRTLEDENTRLRRLLAEAMLDNAALNDLLGKKWYARKEAESCRPSRGRPRHERTAGV